MNKPVRLELNNSGAWKLLGRFDAADDEQSSLVLDAAEDLVRTLHNNESPRGCPTLRVSIDDTMGAHALAARARVVRRCDGRAGVTKSRGILGPRRAWTELDNQMLCEFYADTLTEDLAKALNRPLGSVHQHAAKLGLRKNVEWVAQRARAAMQDPNHGGRAHLIKPGSVPPNKGLRRPGWSPGRMAETQFAKGSKPHTWVPVGSLRINGDGYLDRKVNDLPGNTCVRWHPVHRLVWEAANGPVPDGQVVVFKKGRHTTIEAEITLDAVECITRRELMARNTVHNLPKELVQVVQLRGAINRQINRRAKESS